MMMNKLKLEHLAPYLPYELDVTFDGDEYTHRVVGLNITERGVELISPFDHWGTARVEDCIPILRPLSDLTKEIEHNRERFVPIVDLYGLRSQVSSSDYADYYIENNTAILRMKGVYFYEKLFKTFFEVDIDPDNVSFSIATECWEDDKMTEERISLCGNEMSMYKTLLSWHFDIFGLIDKKLAVDINTLNENNE